MLVRLPSGWNVHDGDGLGSRADVVREFALVHGDGERMPQEPSRDPPGQPSPEFEEKYVLRTDHERHLRSLETALATLDKAFETLTSGARWTAENSLRAWVVTEGLHEFEDQHTFKTEILLVNLSPHPWVVTGASCGSVEWRGTNLRPVTRAAPILRRFGHAHAVPANAAFPTPIKTKVTWTREDKGRMGEVRHLTVSGLTLSVRRDNDGGVAQLPVLVQDDLIRVLPPRSD